ncbi:Potassium ion channel Yvc1 [Geosmithia morbida]|uniref:Potassium ion channel Yvc1 n=1 Tax=Geosmithia morbida TaxID=1094350 RepID=A0A9P5D2S5_9HYPO|nr:Potassium ion channel Yvc1 [Geosmithia morbida]KAF4125403.1 Potassium ion channel Yvc1 [Geosmithia morbida]
MVNRNRWYSAVDRLLGLERQRTGSGGGNSWLREEETLLGGHRNDDIQSAVPPEEVTKVCLRLRHLIQGCVPCELEETEITKANSRIITPKVVKAAKEAGGTENRGCVVYCLLVAKKWFAHEAITNLWDADLHHLQATACGVIAKQIIETEDDGEYLMHAVLLRRYAHISGGETAPPTNVIEKAVDLHEVRVIASSGYQRCISHLWQGWLVQDENDPSVFVDYKDKDSPRFLVHMGPDRMRTPMYQNAAQMVLSILYLALYTLAINSINATGQFDGAELLMYLFTFGYMCDELVKLYKAGRHILGFWNAFNSVLYAFLTASFVLRVIGISHAPDTAARVHYNQLSYNLLAFVAPMFWCRLMLYLDSFRFFGAMLVVLKVMMKESVIFFALLIIIIIGFLQAFIGLDLADDLVAGDVWFIVQQMLKTVLQSPEFEGFERFGHPFGLILQYCFTFIVMVILLNILIALYNSAYEDIYGNADDEYLALFSMKTMQFVRAPDENVFIPPFNLIEVVLSGLCEWWLPDDIYAQVNDIVMGIIYSPLLVVIGIYETRRAAHIRRNRARGDDDDNVQEEWEDGSVEVDFEAEGWAKTCEAVTPKIGQDPVLEEVKKLRSEIDELKALLANVNKGITSS